MQELFIDTAEQLQTLCEKLADSQWLAIDTEFLRERTYYPQFCLLQIANGELAACIDPLRIEDLTPLHRLLENEHITKVLHAGRQDLEIFHQLWNDLPRPIFDTQLAAALIGLGDQIGYGALIQKLTGRSLDKSHVRTDWSQRPLEKQQLRYALDDVIYLGDAYLQLKAKLEELGRIGWLKDDFNTLTDPSTYQTDPTKLWQRIRGRQNLKGMQLVILQALAAWREKQAMQTNRPKGWIIKDDVLVELARRKPKDQQQLERIRGLEAKTSKRHAGDLLAIIAKAAKTPQEQWPRDTATRLRLTPQQEALSDILMCSLRLKALDQNLSPQALGTRKELEQLAGGERDLEILKGWRGALIGQDLLKVLNGDLWPFIQDRELTLTQIQQGQS